MARFLITGGAGFIGSHVAEAIVRGQKGEAVVLDDLSSGHEQNLCHLGGAVRLIRGDIRNPQEIAEAIAGADGVFHLAAFVSAFDSFHKPELTHAVNAVGTRNVLEAARQARVKRVVLASSAAVYGAGAPLPNREEMPTRPGSPYAVAKVENESDARAFSKQHGLETVCLRFFNVFGPRQDPSSEYSGVISRFVDRIRRGQPPVIYGDGAQTRDFVFVADVAAACLRAMASPACGAGEAINIGTGRETSLLELVDALQAAFSRSLRPEFLPRREGDIPRSVADVSRARALLGFTAETNFRSGIRKLVEEEGPGGERKSL